MKTSTKQRATSSPQLLAWNRVAKLYAKGTYLPSWGTSGELSSEDILPNLQGKSVLELGCGSGHSLVYLAKHGAKQVAGLDFSPVQIRLARKTLKTFSARSKLRAKQISLYQQPMEKPLPGKDWDIILSIYSLGWADDPESVMREVFKKLKPGGTFIFSWDHLLSRVVKEEDGKLAVVKNYHHPMPLVRENWKGTGLTIETHQLRPSDWFWMLQKSGFVVTGFWEPEPHSRTQPLEVYSESYSRGIRGLVPTTVVFRAKKPL